MQRISVLGLAACTSDMAFRERLPFACVDPDPACLPPLLRRRSSQAMQLAFSVANAACAQAGRSPESLPAIFASVAGEIRTTDQLCKELAQADGSVSPSAFHNSVQNTVAGYWSIVTHNTQPATALAAGQQTVAMAWLEAWSQLAGLGGELLLVCYDENWPQHLAPHGGQPAFASAWVLAAGQTEPALGYLGKPYLADKQAPDLPRTGMPILATLPLLTRLAHGGHADATEISIGADWWVSVHGASKIA